MSRLLSVLFLFIFSTALWGQQSSFQGRVIFDRDLASFETSAPVADTLYLLTGAVASVDILSQNPFVAEAELVQGVWENEATLSSHRVILRFEGAGWASKVVQKKPRKGAELLVYPYRKVQAAAVPSGDKFLVLALPILF